jgi:hypothetical protein
MPRRPDVASLDLWKIQMSDITKFLFRKNAGLLSPMSNVSCRFKTHIPGNETFADYISTNSLVSPDSAFPHLTISASPHLCIHSITFSPTVFTSDFFFESLTVVLKYHVPAVPVAGMPDTVPSEFSVTPSGSFPDDISQASLPEP